MRRKTRTKALSWLLSLVMMLSFVSGLNITAYATEASTAYVNAAGEAQTPVNATVLENSSGVFSACFLFRLNKNIVKSPFPKYLLLQHCSFLHN